MTSLETKLDELRLAGMRSRLETVLAEAVRRNLSLAASLEWLADLELEERHRRSVERRFHQSRLQVRTGIDAFDFQHHKTRMGLKPRILRLLDLDFIAQGTNLVIIGNPGTGKTFLARIIAWKACQANYRVLFTSAMDMLNQLLASQIDHSLVRRLKVYTAPALLVCDEVGYLSLDQQTSNLFYQVISTRHAERRSTVLTTNTPFSDWGNILYNTTIATAIADRLVENSEVFLLGGESLRKAKKARPRDPKAGSEEAPPCDDNPDRRSPEG
ncbi:MAG: IS21-like element helper ATPase IstB [Acidobacteriota bacterium]